MEVVRWQLETQFRLERDDNMRLRFEESLAISHGRLGHSFDRDRVGCEIHPQ